MKSFCFIQEKQFKPPKVEKIISSKLRYRLNLRNCYQGPGVLRDTFDENLLRRNSILLEYGGKLEFLDMNKGLSCTQQSGDGWSFAGDLSDGPVSRDLEKLNNLRAFLVFAELEVEIWEGKLLDDLDKITVKTKQWLFQQNGKTLVIVVLIPLRGYQQAFDDLASGLKKLGARSFKGMSQLFQALDIPIRNYRNKPRVSLKSDTPIGLSVSSIIRPLFDVIRVNEQGILDDSDTEFLHDYRVSFRKIRALVSLCKGVFTSEEEALLKEELAELMKRTGQLRDLDVLLLQKKRFLDFVPEAVHQGIGILNEYFQQERLREHRRVSKEIKSKAYRKRMKRLIARVSVKKGICQGERAQEPSRNYAAELIFKRYNKVCNIARTIEPTTPDQKVHSLRIHCKKLRYLLESFTPFFKESSMKMQISNVKILQEHLGNFNDSVVQQLFFQDILRKVGEKFSGQEVTVAESIGALTAMLHQLQQEERSAALAAFAHFDNQQTQTEFTSLFNMEVSA